MDYENILMDLTQTSTDSVLAGGPKNNNESGVEPFKSGLSVKLADTLKQGLPSNVGYIRSVGRNYSHSSRHFGFYCPDTNNIIVIEIDKPITGRTESTFKKSGILYTQKPEAIVNIFGECSIDPTEKKPPMKLFGKDYYIYAIRHMVRYIIPNDDESIKAMFKNKKNNYFNLLHINYIGDEVKILDGFDNYECSHNHFIDMGQRLSKQHIYGNRDIQKIDYIRAVLRRKHNFSLGIQYSGINSNAEKFVQLVVIASILFNEKVDIDCDPRLPMGAENGLRFIGDSQNIIDETQQQQIPSVQVQEPAEITTHKTTEDIQKRNRYIQLRQVMNEAMARKLSQYTGN